MPANTAPQVSTAGQTSSIAGRPLVTRIRYAGRINAMGAVSVPAMPLSPATPFTRSRGSPVMPASVITGIPIDPNATGAVFASRQIDDAYSEENPSPTIIAAATATGVPKPAQPSINAPNANAISNACIRLSEVIEPIESLITSNLPVVTVISYSTSAQNTIHEIGKIPKHAPYAALLAV